VGGGAPHTLGASDEDLLRARTAMSKTGWAELSSLVLCDVLAGLPQRQLVRLQRLGQPRLAGLCSLAWVARRMTEVDFSAAVDAYLHGDDFHALCGENVLKRLNGTVEIVDSRLESSRYTDAYATLINKMPGKLHLHLNCVELTRRQQSLLYALFDRIKKEEVVYVTVCSWGLLDLSPVHFPNMILIYFCVHLVDLYFLQCSPQFLNGRCVVDVLRVVMPPSDVANDVLELFRHAAGMRTQSYPDRPPLVEGTYHPSIPLALHYDVKIKCGSSIKWRGIPLIDMTKRKLVHPFKTPRQYCRDEERKLIYSFY